MSDIACLGRRAVRLTVRQLAITRHSGAAATTGHVIRRTGDAIVAAL